MGSRGSGARKPLPRFKNMADENMSEGAEADSEQETALLPRSFFQGKDIEIGKTCEVKVEGVFEDEIEVSYVRHKKDESKPDTLEGADKSLEMMAEPETY